MRLVDLLKGIFFLVTLVSVDEALAMTCLGTFTFDTTAWQIEGRIDTIDGISVQRQDFASIKEPADIAHEALDQVLNRPGFEDAKELAQLLESAWPHEHLWLAAYRSGPYDAPTVMVQGRSLRGNGSILLNYEASAPADGISEVFASIATLDSAIDLDENPNCGGMGPDAFCVAGGVAKIKFQGYLESSFVRFRGPGDTALTISTETEGPYPEASRAEVVEKAKENAARLGYVLPVSNRSQRLVAGIAGNQAEIGTTDTDRIRIFIAQGAPEDRSKPRLEIELSVPAGQSDIDPMWDQLLSSACSIR